MYRRTDPTSSVEAAERHEPRAKTNRYYVLAIVKSWPGCTSRSLAEWSELASTGVDLHEIRRRLPELESAGLVHRRIDKNRSTPDRIAYQGDRDGCFWFPGPAPSKQKELF